jgi:hypothetical protein
MVGLTDVVPATLKVKVAGTEIDVYGVSGEGLAVLIGRYPELKLVMTGRVAELDADTLMKNVPTAIAAIIAAGTGDPGNKTAEAVAAKLPLETQFDLLAAIVKMTMPGGVHPFVEKLSALRGIVQGVKGPGTISSKPPKN